jgi:hypothetical protein
MATDVSLPSVVLFLEGTSLERASPEGTGKLDVFHKVVSGLQRGGRRVHVFVRAGVRPSNFTAPEAPLVPEFTPASIPKQ